MLVAFPTAVPTGKRGAKLELNNTISGVGEGVCSLTKKRGKGLFITFKDEGDRVRFLTYKGLEQILNYKMGNEPEKGQAKT